MANNPNCWVTCADCNHHDRIRRSNIDRRGGVRCSKCGGPVDLSERAREDLVLGADTRTKLKASRRLK